jgi:hypothetical protein
MTTADTPQDNDARPLTAAEEAYQQALAAAGYGPTDRARYIAASGQDPEHAACVWDEQILAAAEAAGIIPEPPRPPAPTIEEQVRNWCDNAAYREFEEAHPDYSPFLRALTDEETQHIAKRAEQLLLEHGEALAEFLRTTPRPAWREDDPDAQRAAAAYDWRILALLAGDE